MRYAILVNHHKLGYRIRLVIRSSYVKFHSEIISCHSIIGSLRNNRRCVVQCEIATTIDTNLAQFNSPTPILSGFCTETNITSFGGN